jgi:predicted lysophospholipase L1 biosynthesis ABC-type transport system permease subunit
LPELITEAITALRTEASAYPLPVQVWMKVMAASFFSGLILSWWDRRALWIVAMAAMTLGLLIAAKVIFPDLPRATSGAVIHLVLWPLGLVALWRSGRVERRVFVIWRYWISALVSVSLILDFKEILGWF